MGSGSGTSCDHWHDPALAPLEDEVTRAEAALLDAQVLLATLRVELDDFALLHHHRLGPLYHRLDELDALIAEAVAACTGHPDDIRRAYEARRIVEPMPDLDAMFGSSAGGPADEGHEAQPDGTQSDGGQEGRRRARSSKETQRLYRELVRRTHPDLTQDEQDKARRSAFLARVNEAYAIGDVTALERLAEEWVVGPEAAPPQGAAERRSWLLGRLTWLQARLAEVQQERVLLEEHPMAQLLGLAPQDPAGLLDCLADQLIGQAVEREQTLRGIVGG